MAEAGYGPSAVHLPRGKKGARRQECNGVVTASTAPAVAQVKVAAGYALGGSLYSCAPAPSCSARRSASAGAELSGHTKRVTCARLHPSKPLVLTASADCTAAVWRTDGAQLHSLRGHTAEVTGVTLHATGNFCVTSSLE